MTDTAIHVEAGERSEHGYTTFRLGGFSFMRDEHFAHIEWPTGSHVLSVEAFLKALMRDGQAGTVPAASSTSTP